MENNNLMAIADESLNLLAVSDAALISMIGRKSGVNIVVTEKVGTFATDGKSLYVPMELVGRLASLGDGCPDTLRDAFLGALTHEAAGHIRCTDFGAKAKNRLADSVLNVLEDIRIEGAIPLMYPGAKNLLGALVKLLAKDEFWQPGDKQVVNTAVFWLMRKWRRTLLSQGAYLAQATEDALEAELDSKGVLALGCQAEAIGRKAIVQATCTGDLIDAANEITDLLVQMHKQEKEDQQDQGQGENESEAQDQDQDQDQGQGQGQGQGEGKKQAPAQQKSKSDQRQDQSGAQGAEQGAEQGSAQDQAGDCGAGLGNQGQETGSDIENMSVAQADLMAGLMGEQEGVNLGASKQVGSGSGESGEPPEQKARPMTMRELAMTGKIAAKVRHGLDLKLRSMVEDEDEVVQTHGRLDMRSIPYAASGLREDVFLEDGNPAPGLDAHVFLLVDCSGSMSGLETHVRCIGRAVVDAFAHYPEVKLTAALFNQEGLSQKKPGVPHARNLMLGYSASGGTDWVSGFKAILPDVFFSRASRKIVLTITDGDVHFRGMNPDNPALKDVEWHFLVLGSSPIQSAKVRSQQVLSVSEAGEPAKVGKAIQEMLVAALDPACA